MTTAGPPVTPPRRPGSNRGAWTIAAIFAVGIAVLVGLFMAPRGSAPALPPGMPRGLPDRPVTGVLLDCRPLGASPDAVVAAVRSLEPNPDLLLLVDVEAALLPPVIEALGLKASYHPQLYQRVRTADGGNGRVGLCVLSRHPLFGGRPVRAGGERPVGVAADAVFGGRACSVACVDLSDSPRALEAAAALGGFDVVAGRLAGALCVHRPAAASEPPTTASADPDFGAVVEVLRRRDQPAGLVFRVGAPAGPATRQG